MFISLFIGFCRVLVWYFGVIVFECLRILWSGFVFTVYVSEFACVSFFRVCPEGKGSILGFL